MKTFTLALAGNPNCGKTTLFNRLTGSKQRIGNWSGVTVERIEGEFEVGNSHFNIIDLPGIYSFSVYSADERVSREYILKEKPDAVINLVDASNLERNLYLTMQLIEMRVPIIIALNKIDLAKRRKIEISAEHLATHLGCPVVEVCAARGDGLAELKHAVLETARSGHIPAVTVKYNHEVEESLSRIQMASDDFAARQGVNPRWLAVKLLESDELADQLTEGTLRQQIKLETEHIHKHTGEDADLVIADGRYGFIHGLSSDVINRSRQLRQTFSDAVDRLMLNRLLGLPIFIAVMYFVFFLTINVGAPFIDFFDGLTGALFVDGPRTLLEGAGAPELLIRILADGVGSGLQTVSTFIPPVFFIFLCLSILESSGYMARAAFIMDRYLRKIGLPGKAFIPMLVGFGCNVPAILATRTLENRRDRLLTILLNPFMSCGARLPVYTLFAVMFFPPEWRNALVMGLYLTGIAVAIACGWLLKSTILKGEISSYVMELPPYHLPRPFVILHDTWTRLKDFIIRAGKVIVLIVILLQLLMSGGGADPENAAVSRACRAVTPAFRPMGIEQHNWPAVVGLLSGIFAKESVIATLDSLYTKLESDGTATQLEDTEVYDSAAFTAALKDTFIALPGGLKEIVRQGTASEESADSRLAGVMKKYFPNRIAVIAYLVFILLYIPCGAVIAAVCQEAGWKWALFGVGYQTFIAWNVSVLFYQLASWTTHPLFSAATVSASLLALALFAFALKTAGKKMEGRLY